MAKGKEGADKGKYTPDGQAGNPGGNALTGSPEGAPDESAGKAQVQKGETMPPRGKDVSKKAK
jgi:hypothetical protein